MIIPKDVLSEFWTDLKKTCLKVEIVDKHQLIFKLNLHVIFFHDDNFEMGKHDLCEELLVVNLKDYMESIPFVIKATDFLKPYGDVVVGAAVEVSIANFLNEGKEGIFPIWKTEDPELLEKYEQYTFLEAI